MTEVAAQASVAAGATATSSSALSSPRSTPSAPSSAASSPNPDAAEALGSGATFRPRKLSAAAKEWAPPADCGSIVTVTLPAAMLHSPSLGPANGGAAEEKDIHDAEDDEELAAVVDAALAAKGSDPALLARALQRQVEYLLSNQSLWKHAALQSEMAKDREGAVSLTALLAQREVAALTSDAATLAAALKPSEKLLMSADGSSVRRHHPLPSFDGYRDSNRVIFCDRLPPGSTVRSIKKLFHRFGKVQYVLRADQMLGASGLHVAEKGQLTPHASPKIKPRSLSNSDVSPSLVARRLAAKAADGGLASPQLGSIGTGSLVHLSPAQRNRVIASSVPAAASDPDSFTAAFIQFAQPACAKKAVSHIVAFNKQLKAQTPKGSPRMMGARRSSLGLLGPGGIPTASLGHSALDGTATPPRARSSRISSSSTQNTPMHSPAHSLAFAGPRMEGLTLGGSAASSHATEMLPPAAHAVASAAAPPRFVTSPPPLHPLSPLEREKQQQRKRANSSASASATSPPPFVPTTVFTSANSPTLAPISSAAPVPPATPAAASAPFSDAHKEGSLPELSLGGAAAGATDATSPANSSGSLGLSATCPTTPINPALVAALPDQFVGCFVMPKIAYLKSLKAKAAGPVPVPVAADKTRAGAASPLLGSAVVSPVNGAPATVPASAGTPREKQPSPPTPTLGPQKNKQQQLQQPAVTSPPIPVPGSAPAPTRQLSAQAPVFNPSPVPLLIPAPVKAAAPVLQASTGSPQQAHRVLKNNWRSDGLPVLSDFSGADAASSTDAAAGAGGAAASMSSPSLGPAAAPTFDEHGNLIPPSDKKKKQKQPKQPKAAGSSPAPEGGANAAQQQAAGSEGDASGAARPAKPDPERAKFSLTKRNSLGLTPENARQVVSRFALGPDAPDAVGFAGRGRAVQRGSPVTLPPAGGGKPL